MKILFRRTFIILVSCIITITLLDYLDDWYIFETMLRGLPFMLTVILFIIVLNLVIFITDIILGI